MLPSGNENLLATYLRLGKSPDAVCRTITSGPAVQLDAGSANGRVFLLMIGCGFDAYVVHRVHAGREGHLSTRNYFGPILESFATYDYPQLRIHWPQHDAGPTARRSARIPSSPANACWLFGFNLPCYGGRLPLAPRASATDGQLDFCAFRHGSLGTSRRYAAAVLLGQHRHLADCTMRRLDHLRVTSEARVPYQLAGAPGGFLPVDIRVLRRRLTVVIPPEYAQRFSKRGQSPPADYPGETTSMK
ncbi:MAG: hypothetical protein A2V70_09470 [Planctomycetes bacterium RBG_13_63_9]|nr:MAG: hypothetical protein A2V70_09470 [Planctomycetes bacterium RBG_13_63_9]